MAGTDGNLSSHAAAPSTTTSPGSSTSTTLTQLNSTPTDCQSFTPCGELDNSSAVQDNLRLPSIEETNTILNVKRDSKLDSLSPSKSEKSSISENDLSEMPSQRSVDSMGSSLDCAHVKEIGSPLALSTEGAVSSDLCPTNDLLCKSGADICDDVDKTAGRDFADAFSVAKASSVFCTCASGHPFVVDPRSLSGTPASPITYPGEIVDSTSTTAACGTILSEKEHTINDPNDSPSTYLLEPNLHLPNIRCTRSHPLEEEETGEAFTCSNFAYDLEEEYFKNDFIQDTYPILSPQQIPYQVIECFKCKPRNVFFSLARYVSHSPFFFSFPDVP